MDDVYRRVSVDPWQRFLQGRRETQKRRLAAEPRGEMYTCRQSVLALVQGQGDRRLPRGCGAIP